MSDTNRLINEKSPYLLQHAHDPVDWHPWDEEAFNKARREDKPVFLSIGYSSCHWCHVMHRESFKNPDIAQLLNEGFVSIKVDREERPDIDSIYMSVCQALNGSGGWPLTIIMTPDKLPFFAATYLPPRSGRGLSGLKEILPQIRRMWDSERTSVDEASRRVGDWVKAAAVSDHDGEIDEKLAKKAYRYFESSFDRDYGGFGRAPKFPSPHQLLFLLRYYYIYREPRALEMVEKTLESMYRGGINDHLAGGFARYSTDRYWLVPHFEKMLYDNALLAIAFLEAYQLTRKPLYQLAASEIFTYILREMRSPEGAFCSAEDADTEGQEGVYYLWDQKEIVRVLGEEAGSEFCRVYGVSEAGNFEGRNVLNLLQGLPGQERQKALAEMREKLRIYRSSRPRPGQDDKVLCSWNGLMIYALALGARVLKQPEYLEAASAACSFILTRLRRADGRLLARYRDGESRYEGYIDDYAFFIWALLEMYNASYEPGYLKTALELGDDMIKYFWDNEAAGFFLYGWDGESLISRPKEVYDGAMPSGNSVAALVLLRLACLSERPDLEEKASKQMRFMARQTEKMPGGHTFYLTALLQHLATGQEIAVVGDPADAGTRQMLEGINCSYRPFALTLLKDEKLDPEEYDFLPRLQSLNSWEGRPTAYLCYGYACQKPVTSWEELAEQLGQA